MGANDGLEKLMVVAVPYAGGDRYAYRGLQAFLPKGIDWITLELPGRGPRRREPRLKSLEEMVESLYSDLQQHKPGSSFVLFGHSMGAILAYELLQKLRSEGAQLPKAAYFSSIAAPFVPRTRFVSHLPKDAFWEMMRSYKGVPDGIIENVELRDYFEPVLRDDFEVIERYTPLNANQPPLDVPMYVRWGSNETIPRADLLRWQECCTLPVDFKERVGDHFFVVKDAAETWSEVKGIFNL